MNPNNANDNSNDKSWNGSSELFRSPESDSQNPFAALDISPFENWLELELVELESRFAHNMTVSSVRADIKGGDSKRG